MFSKFSCQSLSILASTLTRCQLPFLSEASEYNSQTQTNETSKNSSENMSTFNIIPDINDFSSCFTAIWFHGLLHCMQRPFLLYYSLLILNASVSCDKARLVATDLNVDKVVLEILKAVKQNQMENYKNITLLSIKILSLLKSSKKLDSNSALIVLLSHESSDVQFFAIQGNSIKDIILFYI